MFWHFLPRQLFWLLFQNFGQIFSLFSFHTEHYRPKIDHVSFLVSASVIHIRSKCYQMWKETSLAQLILQNTLFQILVKWVTISVWSFSVSRHHLLYSSIPQEVPQHYPLSMVQHFMNHDMKQQFFCFVSSKRGSERPYQFWFWGLVLPTLSTTCISPLGKVPIASH